jgi:hypothetical protein
MCSIVSGVRGVLLQGAISVIFFASLSPHAQTEPGAMIYHMPDQGIALADSIQTISSQSSGKQSRRAKAALRRIAARQTNVITVDTSRSVLEAIRALPRDSSARLAQFTYVRKDNLVSDGAYHKVHSMYLPDPPIMKYQAVLDSTRWIYRLSCSVEKNDVRITTELPFEMYTELRLKQRIRQNWENMAQFYQILGETKTTLGDVFGKITKIEVPVPKNPLFSIFGPNIIRLTINGAIDIHAGFRNTKSDAFTASPLGQSRNEPDFKQEIQVNVKGEIGDKLKIDADWNTQRTFEYENQLKVRYTGYEDEIVQSVEAGNVSLPTNSSFFNGGQALFGLKALFQVGPLRLTTVATQKKGQIKEISISGGSEAKQIEIRPSNYSTNHFFIDESYIPLYEQCYRVPLVVDADMQRQRIREIEVWVSSRSQVTEQTKEAIVVAFLNQDSVIAKQDDNEARKRDYNDPPRIEQGRFYKLQVSDFSYHEYAGIISIYTSLQPDQAIAVAYVISNPDGSIRKIGNLDVDRTDSLKLIMKLVRPKGLGPEMEDAWELMVKNRYSLGVMGVEKNSFNFQIDYQVTGSSAIQEVPKEIISENIGLLELFGLDRFTGDGGQLQPDKEFDYFPKITIDETHGEIIFPTVKPFSMESIKKNILAHKNAQGEFAITDADTAEKYADSLAYKAIYDTSATVAMNDIHNKYYLRGSVKGGIQDNYSLGFNIVEGSVKVSSGGQTLTPGVDYTVDYIYSKVVIKNKTYLVPGRDLSITYEANDLFQLASKSLLGARGEFNVGKNSSLGFTIMNYSQQSLSDKVRLGEEPISNLIMGIDGGTSVETPWLTNALNYLPGVKTIAPSQISFRGEVAYMLPNPNTRTSPISSDGSKGVAYIDDFEGARQIIPLGGSYAGWREASAPWFIPFLDELNPYATEISTSESMVASGDIMPDSLKMNYKGKATWFNVIPTDVFIPDIWGDKKYFAQGEGQVSALDFYFRPMERGAFNYAINGDSLEKTIGLNNTDPQSHTKAWAGIQHILGTTTTNLIEQNVAFIELWINIVETQDSLAKLNIDLGYISEDIIPDRRMDTEDGLDVPNRIPRGILNPNYDWGFDMMKDDTERVYFADFIKRYPQYADDPSGDNWKRLPIGTNQMLNMALANIYEGVNGTEGNYQSEEGQLPDGEDLNRDNNLTRLNRYFEYELPLDRRSPAFRQYVTGSSNDSTWLQIRIPLPNYVRKIGGPVFTSIEGVRLWVTGAQKPMLFRIVEFNLVGNQWEKRVRSDSILELSVVNIEDDPSYTSPPGVQRQRDLTRPDQQLYGNEQSLNIIVRGLRDGQEKEAVRNFTGRPLDMFNYRTLKMFVHGENRDDPIKGYRTFKFTNTADYDAEFFIRFGDDTLHYYEYRAPIQPGWVGNDVLINFAELTSIKNLPRDSKNMASAPIVGGPIGAKYQVRGNPRLDKIQFISIGIANPDGIGVQEITGELWANELRLTDVDDTPGWAYKFDTNIKLADLGSIGFSLTQRDPFFHGLEDRFGSRNTSKSWNISAAFSVGKLLPDSWSGSSLDLSYSHSESMNKPRYLPGQDVLVEEAASRVAADTSTGSNRRYKDAEDVRLRAEDLSITDSYSAQNIRMNVPLKTWLITETINKMQFGYTFSMSRQRSPSIQYSESWNWSANFRYGTQFNPNNFITPFSIFGDFFIIRPWKNLKIFYTPKNFNIGATLTRSQARSQARDREPNPITRNLAAQRSMDFNWQFFDGGLLDLGLSYNVSISSTLQHLETDKLNRPRSFSDILNDIFLSDRLINFGIDQNYGQGMVFSMKVRVPEILKLDKIFTPSLRYQVNYNWTNNTQLGPLGRNAGWNGGPTLSLDVSLKPISESIWSVAPAPPPTPADTTGKKKTFNPLKQLDQISRILIKIPFFDFDRFNFSFSQQNSVQNSGIRGSNGFANLFARVPFFQSSLDKNGPSLWYQLGLSTDPNGYPVVKTKSRFPFITGYTVPGLRADSAGNIVNAFSQNNQISLRTSRSLWEGASLTLDWKTGWSYSKNVTNKTDAFGRPTQVSSNVSGDINRSYMTLPPVFIFKFFNSSIENVNKKYLELKSVDDGRKDEAKLSQAFEEGLEVFPWLSKIIGSLAPRANWTIRWSGLEKFSFLNSFASSISLDHAYTSDYRQRWRVTQEGGRVTESQAISYRFSPLVGMSIAFKPFLKGNLSANFQFGASSSYDLVPVSQKTYESKTSDISVTGTYSRQGFEIPFFGLSLMNNIDISFSYSYSHNSRLLYDFANFKSDGIPQEGSSRTTIEPRIRYTLSERVTASLYYRYTKLTPDEGGSRIPGSTVNEGGVDVHVAIQ